MAGCRIVREAFIFPAFYNAHHLDPRSITHLVESAQSIHRGAEYFNGELPIHDGHAWRVLVVMPGEGPAR